MKDAEGEPLCPSGFFWTPEEGDADPRAIAARLIESCDEFADLAQSKARVLFLFRVGGKRRAGKTVLGEMALPRFQGALGDVGVWLLARHCAGVLPDFICILDADWWAGATAHRREALVHHELKHCAVATDTEGEKKFTEDGDPVWSIRAHDLEEFRSTVLRYGHWLDDISAFVDAALGHGA